MEANPLPRFRCLAADRDTPAGVTAADAVCRLRFDDAGLRPLLDAAALAIPVVTTSLPALDEILPPPLTVRIPANHPLSLFHALADLSANPTAVARRCAAAYHHVVTRHNPADWLPRWQAALESAAAGRASGNHLPPGQAAPTSLASIPCPA